MVKSLKILVCGGRDYKHDKYLFKILDSYLDQYRIECLIHGGARGADSLAGLWAKRRDIPVECFPANWNKHGLAAGPIRNKQMLTEGKPDLVIAFAGGKGTANMIEQAKQAGIKVDKFDK